MRNYTYLLIILFLISGACQNNPDQETQKITRPEVNSKQTLQQHLLTGWNTWNNPSVLSRVKMPEGLNLQLLFRKKRGGPYWLKDSYIFNTRRGNFPEKINPIAHAYDGSYVELEMEWEGLKAHVASASDGDNIYYLYAPLELPEQPPVLIMQASFLWNKPGYVDKKDSLMIAHSRGQYITIRATRTSDQIKLPLDAPYFSCGSDQEVAFYTGAPKDMASIKAIIEQKKMEHQTNIDNYGDLSEAYHAMQAVNSWNIIYDAQNDRTVTSVSRVWNEAWGGYIIFDWDTYFAGLMLSLDNKYLGYSNCIAISEAITENGFVPNLEASFGLKSFDRSQPPVGSIVCKLIYDKYQDKWFLEEVYDELLSWNEWWPQARDNQGYLSWGSDPHPMGMDGHSAQGAKWESGLDNSPMFDEAVFNKEKNVFDLASVGLMGLYVADCKNLAEIARILGKEADAKALEGRGEKYGQKLQELWDEESGIYRDKNLQTGEFTSHLSPTHFYPLLGQVPSQAQADRMINEHFFNPNEFYGDWIMPSIARNDPGFADNSYWRGRIWAPMNFLVYLGLRKYDLPQAQKELADKSRDLILKEWTENRRVYENYNSVTGVGGDVRNSDSFYSWGGLLALIPIIEAGYY
ncbi:MAG: MGH1-like glycoside hydrolase domain-containing protein [Candidatus Cyclobacteriaceae bacterium M3_2C_046]